MAPVTGTPATSSRSKIDILRHALGHGWMAACCTTQFEGAIDIACTWPADTFAISCSSVRPPAAVPLTRLTKGLETLAVYAPEKLPWSSGCTLLGAKPGSVALKARLEALACDVNVLR